MGKGSPRAPVEFGPSGRALWRSVVAWSIDGRELELQPVEIAVLRQACATADVIAKLEAAAADAPAMVPGSKGQAVVNPLVAEIRMQRLALRSLLASVKLPELATTWELLTPSQRARGAARARWG